MDRKILSIMERNRATAFLSDLTDSVKTAIDASIVFKLVTNFAFSTSMYLLWGFINTLQMILYLPMLEVNFPANVKFMYSILLSVASLDLIPSEYTTQLVFNFSVDLDKPFSNILEELGYETHNSILNLGSIFVYLVFFFVGIVFIYVIKISGIQKN